MGFRNREQLAQRVRGMVMADYGSGDGDGVTLSVDDVEDLVMQLWETEVGYDPEASELAGETAFCVPAEGATEG